MFSSSN